MSTAPLILFANDDPLYLSLMQVLLTDAGYTQVVTTTNTDAHLTARTQQPTLILLDISVGAKRNGWAALDRLTLDPLTTHIPLIVCSTSVRTLREKADWFARHQIGVLEKPFNVPDVLAVIARMLAPPRSD